ncbi:hypothetical protein IAU60_005055 [Kwoniella sp. DSM 27419]
MQRTLVLQPIALKDSRPSEAGFQLRHKHVLKKVYLSNGTAARNGLTPTWAGLQQSKQALQSLPMRHYHSGSKPTLTCMI